MQVPVLERGSGGMRLTFYPDEHSVTISTETHVLRVEAVGPWLFEAMTARDVQGPLVDLAREHGAPKLELFAAGRDPPHLSAGIVAEHIAWSGDV